LKGCCHTGLGKRNRGGEKVDAAKGMHIGREITR